jgi:hypothetical protein
VDAEGAWTTFAEHAARLYRVGRERMPSGNRWLAVVSGGDHPDLNPAVLLPGATSADARALLAALADAGVPGLISLPDTADPGAAAELRAGGYVAAPLPEALMRCTVRPGRADGGFRVARVRDRGELDIAIAVAAEAHVVDVASAQRTLRRDVREGEGVGTWIAWDGDDPVSVVWLTTGDHIGVWSMMTPVRHRRRGAGRAVLTGALDDVWSGTTRAALLWATPAGRPLYESVGFRPVTEGISWVPAGFEAEVTALGHPG